MKAFWTGPRAKALLTMFLTGLFMVASAYGMNAHCDGDRVCLDTKDIMGDLSCLWTGACVPGLMS